MKIEIIKNEPVHFSLKARLKSFKWAFEGMMQFFTQEHNAVLHALATIVVFVLAFLYRVQGTEILLIIFSTGLVWTAELFNTCIEKIMDIISPERRRQVKYIKDLSAAAVLVAAIVAAITGLIIFIPKIF